MLAAQSKAKFGSVKEISAVDYVDEVNKAGDGVWVVLHLYKTGYPFPHQSIFIVSILSRLRVKTLKAGMCAEIVLPVPTSVIIMVG